MRRQRAARNRAGSLLRALRRAELESECCELGETLLQAQTRESVDHLIGESRDIKLIEIRFGLPASKTQNQRVAASHRRVDALMLQPGHAKFVKQVQSVQSAERPDQQQDRDRDSKQPEQSVSTHCFSPHSCRSHLSSEGESAAGGKVPSCEAWTSDRRWNSVERLIVKERKS